MNINHDISPSSSSSSCVSLTAMTCDFPFNQLTSVHAKVTVVLVQSLQGGDVRRPLYYLIHPLDGSYHLVAFLLSEDRGALVL